MSKPNFTPTPQILLFRHGETQWNREGRYQGQQDSPLTLTGIGQIRAIAETLRDQINASPNLHIWSSPLTRTRQSVSILCEHLGLDYGTVQFDDRLMERNYGRWEGLTRDEIEDQFPDDVAAEQKDRWSFAIPGGESFADVDHRLRAWRSGLNPDVPILVMAHGGSGRVLRGLCTNQAPEAIFAFNDPQSSAFHIQNSAVQTIDASPQHLVTFGCADGGLGVHI